MARVAFDRILKQVDHKETYALVALGNDKLQVLHSETKPENKQTISEDAVKLFADALKWDNKNVYAANGLAIAMAETGYLVEAKDAFSQIREAYPTLTSAQVNLAHVWVELGQYHSAIALVRLIAWCSSIKW
jgi:RNA polymerase-associated protein CTR9